MSDIFLKRIYNDIKDESWPIINGYYDFNQLPDYIKHEVKEKSGNILRDRNFYKPSDLGSVALVHKDTAFITNTKTASTYYKNFFIGQGWKLTYLLDLDFKNTYCFGFISDPIYRYFRGLSHCLLLSHFPDLELTLKKEKYSKKIDEIHKDVLEHLNLEYCSNFIKNIKIADKHTSRYTDIFEDNLYNIDWIPFEAGDRDSLTNFVNKVLSNRGFDITVPITDKELQKALPLKKIIYKKIEELYNTDKVDKLEELYYYYYHDIKFYYDLVEKFNPHGNNWNEISWLRKQ